MRKALFILVLIAQVRAFADFRIVRSLASGQRTDEAIQVLKAKTESSSNPEERALAWFALGILHYDSGNNVESQRAMQEALHLKTRLEDFAHYYLGLSYRKTGNIPEAKRAFAKVIKHKPTSQRFTDAKFQLGEIALQEKDYREARIHFVYLERKTRRTSQYPSVLWDLARAEQGIKARYNVCRHLRRLYIKYPAASQVVDWGVDLHRVEVDGQKPACVAGPNDFKNRIRNLQLAGYSQKAREEIEVLRGRSASFTKSYVDMILANFLINEGHVEEAFKILVPYYKERIRDYSYLMLLAKAAARAGEFQIAAGSYQRAYQLTPNSRKGREALFQAAYLSYQNQDYDGAARKFTDFLRKFSGSGLSRDSQWYLAWISYLKGDYDLAYDKFSKLGRVRTRRGRVVFTQDRIDYWRAMSLMKAGRISDARKIFHEVASDKLLGYYALAAKARLELIKQEDQRRGLASETPKSLPKIGVFKPLSEGLVSAEPPPLMESESGELAQQEAPQTEDEEGESGIQLSDAEESEETATEKEPAEEVAAEDAGILKSSFQDPRLASRFKRASDLATLGFQDWARWELWEIEKRTRNHNYLKMLMADYELNGAFHRSSSIAQVDFGIQRARLGFDKGRYLWQYSYPKAFEKTALNHSRSFGVPVELVWSIMRAESRYKPDVISPVGAMGLMQIMPYTAERVASLLELDGFKPAQLMDPELNIRLGARYLSRLSDRMNNQIPLIAAAYNAGPHRVAAWLKAFGRLDQDEFIEHIPFFETRNYVKKVVHNYYIYSQLYLKDSKKALMWLTQPSGVSFDGPLPTKEDWDI